MRHSEVNVFMIPRVRRVADFYASPKCPSPPALAMAPEGSQTGCPLKTADDIYADYNHTSDSMAHDRTAQVALPSGKKRSCVRRILVPRARTICQ